MLRPIRRSLLIVALVGLSVQPIAGQEGPATADPARELAAIDALYNASEFRQASDRLGALLNRSDLTTGQRAAALVRLAAAQVELGDYDAALRTADEAETQARAAGDPESLIRAILSRGSSWRFRGFPYRGVEHYRQALDVAEREGLDRLRGQALAALASVHQQLADWDRTLDYAERAFATQQNPSDAARFAYLLNRGIAYYEFHDRDEAERAFIDALEVARRWGNPRAESLAIGELGLVAWEFDRDYAGALEQLSRALDIAREIGVPQLQATWLNNMGGASRDAGDYGAAIGYFRQAVAVEEQSTGRAFTPALLKNLGQTLALAGNPAEAEGWLRRALEQADRQQVDKIRWQARMELGSLLRDRDAAEADRFFRESLDLLEAHQASVLLEGFRSNLLGRALDQYDPYDRYIQFLLSRGEGETAFAVAERGRARVFLETLTRARAELAQAIPEDYRNAEVSELARISTLQSELRQTDLDPARRRAIVSSITQAENALTALRLRLAADRPALAQVRFPRVWSLAETQTDVLGDGEVLVLYFLGRDRSAAWIVQREASEVVTMPSAHDIGQAVGAYLPTLQSPGAELDQEARSRLTEMLVAPILERVPPDARLTIVPHGILHYLPFETLAADRGQYLVERYAIAYAPSVSSLAFLRQRAAEGRTGSRVLAVGSPITGSAGVAGERNLPFEWVGLLKPLPHSGPEVRGIAAMFADSRLLEGAEATEDRLREGSLDDVAVLHFATHALIDEERPERSGLALSAGAGGSDGLLQTREVYQLRLRAALVTLSACQTALGDRVSGEGIVGLSRAFFFAGADAVTASLWSVNDASTAELMTHFYDRLRVGLPIDAALAEAKRALLAADSTRRHPYYWAPFVVSGSAHTPIDLPPAGFGGVGLAMLGLALAAALAISGLLVRRRRSAGASA